MTRDSDAGAGKLLTLEAGRFFAALLVMLFHYSSVVGEPRGSVVFHDAFRSGHVGVPYFFVLSGFIIYHVHARDLGSPQRLARFLSRRAIRLFPMFWLISLAMLAGFLLIPSLASEREITGAGLLADLLLLPHADAVLAISWTLRHEMVFYAFFALAIWIGPRAFWLLGGWIVASLAGAFAGGSAGGVADLGLRSLVDSPLNLGFGLGILCATFRRKLPLLHGGLWAATGALALVGLCVLEWNLGRGVPHAVVVLGPIGDVAYLVSSALLVFGLVAIEGTGWHMPTPRLWSVLGGSSYALYLVHQPVASLLMRVAHPLQALSAETAMAILAIIAIAVSIAAHVILERPLQRLLGISAPTRQSATGGTA